MQEMSTHLNVLIIEIASFGLLSIWTTESGMRSELVLLILVKKLLEVQGCEYGQLRQLEDGRIEVCYEVQEWRTICHRKNMDRWNQRASNIACRQLGYSGKGAIFELTCFQSTNRPYARINTCTSEDNSLKDCGIIDTIEFRMCQDDCGMNQREHPKITCSRACTNGDTRLVDGATNGEGRVEVCVNGGWGTVCNRNNSTAIARMLCGNRGFPLRGALLRTFQTGNPSLPVYNCTILSNMTLQCEVDKSCNHSMDLGVQCLSEDILQSLVNKTCPVVTSSSCSKTTFTKTESIFPTIITATMCTNSETLSYTTISLDTNEAVNSSRAYTRNSHHLVEGCNNQELQVDSPTATALGGVVGVLVVIIVGLVVGWAVTCGVMIKQRRSHKSKQRFTPQSVNELSTQQPLDNPNYELPPLTGYGSSGPAYEETDQLNYLTINQNAESPNQMAIIKEEHNYHVLEGPFEGAVGSEGVEVCDYEVPLSSNRRESEVQLCGEEQYSKLQY